MRFVAAEAGFLPPGPCTVFADMVARLSRRVQNHVEAWCALELPDRVQVYSQFDISRENRTGENISKQSLRTVDADEVLKNDMRESPR